jgi:outer membrane receptor protein involved in Fe transport
LRAANAAENAARREIEARSGKVLRDTISRDEILAGVPIWLDDVPTVDEFFSFGTRANQSDRTFQDITTLYATDNIFFNEDRTNIIVGVRNIDLDQRSTSLGGSTTSELSGSDTNFQFGAVHRINPNLSVFASVADAFRPQNRTDPDTGELVGPQTSDAFEFGFKFADLYDGKLSGSVALFRIEQSNVFRADHNPVTFVSDSAITDDLSEGFEFELFYNPVPNWNIVAAYSYIDAKVVGEVATGLPLEGATPHRFTLFNSYTVQEGPLAGARFGGGLVFADGPIAQFGNTVNSLVVEDGYTVFDLFARFPVEFGDRDWTFGINIDNATDEFFVRSRAATNEARQILFSLSTDL